MKAKALNSRKNGKEVDSFSEAECGNFNILATRSLHDLELIQSEHLRG